MAQKSQSAGGVDAPPSAASSAPKNTAEASSSHKQSGANVAGATFSVLPKMSDPSPSYGQGTTSSTQPISKAASSGSNPPSRDAAAAAGPSPYGTRSRNRPRPNYAEDVDLDLFDMAPERRDEDPKKASRQTVSSSAASSSTPKEDATPRAANGSSRKPLPAENKTPANGSKDQQSQSTTPSVSTTTTSKKRKAASQATSQPAQAAVSEPASAQALQKKAGAANSGGNSSASTGPHKGYAATNLLSFEIVGSRLRGGKLIADDGTVLEVNDHIYLVCEPPGEPYYLARIMEFLHVKNDAEQPVDALKVNWYYRPKDIARKVNDTRAVFATMHSDISPLTSLRGKCVIKHKAEIKSLDEYRKSPDCFWFEKLYDRYIQKNYEVIPTFQIINVPERVKKVLDERWKYILVEQGRGKEFTSAVKLCKRCSGYCARDDSVDCAVCQNTYHMNCVRPPLLKKPSRGFAWSCAACSRAQERKLEARNTPNVGVDSNAEADEEEYFDEEDEEMAGVDTGRTSPDDGAGSEPHPQASEEQMYQASLWPYRYLGMHCKVEDALDYDDRIYPRASTRVGPRHQATVMDWPGRPVKFVKPPEIEIKKGGRKDGRLTKEAQAALEAHRIAKAKRPKWIQDEPPGYVPRGEDLDNDDPNNTAQLLWAPATQSRSISDAKIDKYMDQAKTMAKSLGLPDRSTNLQDVARDVLFRNGYDTAKALKELPKLDKSVFREPELSTAEQKKFEEGVSKFGSELHSVKKHVKTLEPGVIVRYYYTWKKTERGRPIWANYSGRKGKKEAKEAKKAEAASQSKLQDDVADDHDDSAFDSGKAAEKKRLFICKFCNTKQSRQWRRAPNAAGMLVTESGGKGANKDKGNQYIVALCRRCAELWRRYAVQWEDIEQLVSKVAQAGGRAWKKKIDEELLKEIVAAEQRSKNTVYSGNGNGNGNGAGSNVPAASANGNAGLGSNQPATAAASPAASEPPRKKLKTLPQDRDLEQNGSESGSVSGAAVPGQQAKTKKEKAQLETERQKEKEKPPPPPPQPVVPEWPPPKIMPCSVCGQVEPQGDQHVSCRECRMTVHRNCYGVIDNRSPGKWVCDMCANDKNPHVSIHYKCVLCPVEHTEHDFVEPPKISHKKKTEKDRERERLERERALATAEHYQRRQVETNRPANPREPLKRTADNNWVHVTCAVWTPEVKFGTARALEPSEGIPSIPRARYAEVCKACKQTGGACVACHHCKAPVHVECAHQAGFLLGFDITPVKGSRRAEVNVVSIGGETGAMSAAIWCKEHVPQKTLVHHMHDPVDGNGMNALQLYVQNFKKADLTLTGCARKANLITTAARMSSSSAPSPTAPTAPSSSFGGDRRASTSANLLAPSAVLANGDTQAATNGESQPGGKICLTCGTDVSPRWYPIDKDQERDLVNGFFGNIGVEAQKFVAQRFWQCHKCKKANKQPRPHSQAQQGHGTSSSSSSSLAAGSRSGSASLPSAPNGAAPASDRSGAAAAVAVAAAGPSLPPPPPPPHVPELAPTEPSLAVRTTPPITSPRVHPPGVEHGPPPTRVGSFGWSTPLQAPHQAGMVSSPSPVVPAPAAGPAPPIQAPPIVAPSIAPPPLPLSMPPRVSPAAAPTQPPPGVAYPSPSPASYGSGSDWHRTVHHPPPLHPQVNGGPQHPGIAPVAPSSIPPLVPPNLRPPPLGGLSHGSPHGHHSHIPMTNGHMAQPPLANGVPPPRRLSGPPPPPVQGGGPGPGSASYGSSPYHHHHHHHHHAPPPPPSQHLTNGMVPPRIDHPFSQVLNPPQRSPFATPHASPAVSRDHLPPSGREPPPLHPPSVSRPESRPASGASASPSLRNLLS